MSKPSLIVMSGLPGSGKSTIAEQIAARLKITLLSVDPIESAIIKAGVAKSFATGLAAYLVAEALAAEQIQLGCSVIVDAVNAEEEGKDVWRGLADRYGLDPIILDVFVGDQELHRKRLESRVRGLHGFAEITWDAVEARQKGFTAWKEPTLRLDSAQDIETNIDDAIRYILARQSKHSGSSA